jgi:tRNA(Ile)-lysidine synthase
MPISSMLTLPPTPLRPGDRVCIAISGGADSTALLLLIHAANTLPKNSLGVGLSAIHINHTLRGEESEADQAFVQTLCDRLQIHVHIHRVDTKQHAETDHETLEEAARNLRYAAFEALLNEGKATHILTAHTLDDQAETVLMKLLRGAWLEGLAAIAPEITLPHGKILRPLLRTRRDELRAYLTALNQPWREDSSNSDESFTRNRLRHTLLPALRAENPAIDQTLANLAELAREEESRWQTELTRILPQLILPGTPVRGGGRRNSTLPLTIPGARSQTASSFEVGSNLPSTRSLAIELERLRPLDPALRRRVIRAAARQLGARLSFDETARILTLAGFPPSGIPDPTVPAKAGAILKLSQNLAAQRTLRELRLFIPAV